MWIKIDNFVTKIRDWNKDILRFELIHKNFDNSTKLLLVKEINSLYIIPSNGIVYIFEKP